MNSAATELTLNDPIWATLETSYGTNCDDLRKWLRACEEGEITKELLGDIINDANHQGDTSPAMYAVAVMLIQLAGDTPRPLRRSLLVAAGMLHADAAKPTAAACPAELRQRFDASAAVGRDLLLESYADGSFVGHIYYLAALSAFTGYPAFGRLLEGFDLDEGRHWHVWLDGVIEEPQR